MPRIELILPGEQRTRVEPFAETYRVTVERVDGIACSEIEARTALSTFCVHTVQETKQRKRKPKPEKSRGINELHYKIKCLLSDQLQNAPGRRARQCASLGVEPVRAAARF